MKLYIIGFFFLFNLTIHGFSEIDESAIRGQLGRLKQHCLNSMQKNTPYNEVTSKKLFKYLSNQIEYDNSKIIWSELCHSSIEKEGTIDFTFILPIYSFEEANKAKEIVHHIYHLNLNQTFEIFVLNLSNSLKKLTNEFKFYLREKKNFLLLEKNYSSQNLPIIKQALRHSQGKYIIKLSSQHGIEDLISSSNHPFTILIVNQQTKTLDLDKKKNNSFELASELLRKKMACVFLPNFSIERQTLFSLPDSMIFYPNDPWAILFKISLQGIDPKFFPIKKDATNELETITMERDYSSCSILNSCQILLQNSENFLDLSPLYDIIQQGLTNQPIENIQNAFSQCSFFPKHILQLYRYAKKAECNNERKKAFGFYLLAYRNGMNHPRIALKLLENAILINEPKNIYEAILLFEISDFNALRREEACINKLKFLNLSKK